MQATGTTASRSRALLYPAANLPRDQAFLSLRGRSNCPPSHRSFARSNRRRRPIRRHRYLREDRPHTREASAEARSWEDSHGRPSRQPRRAILPASCSMRSEDRLPYGRDLAPPDLPSAISRSVSTRSGRRPGRERLHRHALPSRMDQATSIRHTAWISRAGSTILVVTRRAVALRLSYRQDRQATDAAAALDGARHERSSGRTRRISLPRKGWARPPPPGGGLSSIGSAAYFARRQPDP